MLTPKQALKEHFNFDAFRKGQEEAIQRTINKQSTLLVMPTGAGKSLAYQLPALMLPGLTLVISPLISLMKDQVDQLTALGVSATYINSSLPSGMAGERMRAVLEGHVKLLYIAPERLRNSRFMQALANIKISLLAIDEAHCVSEWGHDFRPDYLRIGPTWQAMGRPTLLATTATATPQVQRNVINLLGLDTEAKTIVAGFNRPNLTFSVKMMRNDEAKRQTLQALLHRMPNSSVIVYASTRRNTEEVAAFINSLGRSAQAYHGGMYRETRHQVQDDFMNNRASVVVATNAFGMGIDKSDVRAVVHYNLPGSVEAYYQEAGRAGRDGLPAECLLLFSMQDMHLQKRLIKSDTPTFDDLVALYHCLEKRAADNGEAQGSLQELADDVNQHPFQVRLTLSELELAGLIHHLQTQGMYSQWRMLNFSERVLRKRAADIQKRQAHRLGLLETMWAYTQLTTCRREFLLRYFGDMSSPKSPQCCDNHQDEAIESLPRATTPEEWYPLIILDTVNTVRRPVGRKRLSEILGGSQAAKMKQLGYTHHKFYNKLGFLQQQQITTLVDKLLAAQYLRLEGAEYPVLQLNPTGKLAIRHRVALPIHLDDEAVRRKPRASDTVGTTFDLFAEGLSPAEIATERDLKESTIYNHIAKLITQEKVKLEQVVSDEVVTQILEAVAEVGSTDALFPIKMLLPDEFTYEQIRCVLAAHPNAAEQADHADSDQPLPPKDDLLRRVVALGNTGEVAHVPELVEALHHADGKVRRLAAAALGKIGDSQAVPPLLNSLTEEQHPQVRLYIIKALGKIGDPQARPGLEQVLEDEKEQSYVIGTARTALKILVEDK